MGCRKLSYYQEGEGLENCSVFFGKTLEKKRGQQIFCLNYYPFGLEFNSFTRSYSTAQNYKFNQGTTTTHLGEEGKSFRVERQPELGVDFTKFRVYDPALGRFWNIDPAADQVGQEVLTPYQYSFNNPIRYNDPFGDCPKGDCWGALKNAVKDMKASAQATYERGAQALNDAGNAIADATNAVGDAIVSGLEAADQFVTGNSPETNSHTDNSIFGREPVGKTLVGERGGDGPAIGGQSDGQIDVTDVQGLGINGPPGARGDFEAAAEMGQLAVESGANVVNELTSDNVTVPQYDTLRGKFSTPEIQSANYRVVVDQKGDTLEAYYYVPDDF